MGWLGWGVLVAGAVLASLGGLYLYLRYRHRVRLPDWVEHSSCTTEDGYGVSLTRYPPRPGAAAPRSHPVLMCGGLGANRFTFDVGDGTSLARYLAEDGWDVWVVELRAHGRSPTPWHWWWYGWCFDDHVEQDLPAALGAVRETTGADAIHMVGHSLGGVLAYAHAARRPEELRSGVAIGASLDYSGADSVFHAVVPFTFLRHVLRGIPIGFLAAITSPLAARRPSKLDALNIHFGNIEGPLYRRLNAIGFHTVSTRMLAQLATAMRPGGLRARDGSHYLERLAQTSTPILAVAGSVDLQCSPDAARQTIDAIEGPKARLAVFGEAHGHADDYAHIDLVLGKRARDEVWPVIRDWLESHD